MGTLSDILKNLSEEELIKLKDECIEIFREQCSDMSEQDQLWLFTNNMCKLIGSTDEVGEDVKLSDYLTNRNY